MGQHTIQDLHQMQSLPLNLKIRMTERRLREWVDTFGVDGVYISFSGGKDSTVLLDIARKMYPNILAVFIDTGLEYPEIRQFVKTYDNVEWLKPKLNFKQVIQEYGYPFISKEVAGCVYGARKYIKTVLTEREREYLTTTSTINSLDKASMQNPSRGGTTVSIENSEEFMNILKRDFKAGKEHYQKGKGSPYRVARILGRLTKDNQLAENIPSYNKSNYAQTRYKFFLDAPFEISDRCCNVMKKSPAHIFCRKTGRKPITAQMASESRLRTQKWLQSGCNAFDAGTPISNPMSFWTEQDVLLYIKLNNLPIASVYGDIVSETDDELSADSGLFDENRPLLKTTGCNRTGCMFCGFGCHLEDKGEGRFLKMKETHPAQYKYIMKPLADGGLGFKEVIDWINKNGNFNIEY